MLRNEETSPCTVQGLVSSLHNLNLSVNCLSWGFLKFLEAPSGVSAALLQNVKRGEEVRDVVART